MSGRNAGSDAALQAARRDDDLWVFAYGSLMWRPGFQFTERVPARLVGYSRSFCVYSFHHRGTPARPGLVLGLDRGGACEGIAYRVEAAAAAGVMTYLRQREQVSGVYHEARRPVGLLDGSGADVQALAYVVERAHPQYAGALGLAHQAHLIRGARGNSGVNLEYLLAAIKQLRDLGIRERAIERLASLVGPHLSAAGASRQRLPAMVAMTNSWRQRPTGLARIEVSANPRFCHRRER